MAQYNPVNPFISGKYVSDEYFCDRDAESDFLMHQVENGRNVALVSPRRLGKSELIKHCFRQPRMSDHFQTIYVDIYATSSLQELVYLLSKAVYALLKSKPEQWRDRFFQTIASLRVGFKLDAITGEPKFDIGLGDIQSPGNTLDEVFQYLEGAETPCVVAIDEFQQIAEYKEKNTEALLRTYIQNCRQTSFIFSGSKRHLMTRMFNTPAKPFYQSAITMSLKPIPINVYTDFAMRLFAERNRSIEPQVVERVYHAVDGVTWYMQLLMNELFALTNEGEKCQADLIAVAQQNVVRNQEDSYKEQLAKLSPRQKQLMQALAREGAATGVTTAEFIKRHRLASASSVQAAMNKLLQLDLVTHENNEYRINDRFFALWLATNY